MSGAQTQNIIKFLAKLALGGLLFAPHAIAASNAQVDLSCLKILQFGAQDTSGSSRANDQTSVDSIKPEHFLINSAMARHYSVKEIKPKDTQRAFMKFIELIDPFQITFSQAQLDYYASLPEHDLELLHKEVMEKDTRNIHAGILNESIQKINHLTLKFTHEKDYRDQVFTRFAEVKEKVRKQLEKLDASSPFERTRPSNVDELEDAFIDVFVEQMLIELMKSEDKSRGYVRPLTDREAFVVALRKMREEILNLSEELSPDLLPLVIAKSYIASFDPHSDLLLPHELEAMGRRFAGEAVGIGVDVMFDVGGVRIMNVVENSPSWHAGLRPGDLITHISSEEIRDTIREKNERAKWLATRGANERFTGDYMLGKEGTNLQLRVMREGKLLSLDITRKKIDLGSSKAHVEVVDMPRGKIAHIHFFGFYDGVADDIREQLAEALMKHNISGVALDLRNNGGGRTTELAKVLGIFIKEGNVFKSASKENVTNFLSIAPNNHTLWDGPMIVMTNAMSASASEAAAGNLQDYGRAIVVGGRSTFGKGSQQYTNPLKLTSGQQFAIKVTEDLYYTASGRSPQNVGIISDVELPQPGFEYNYEREYENTIPGARINSFMSNIETYIPDIEIVKAKLNELSKARQEKAPKKSSPYRQYDQTTQESFAVLMDLVELLNK